MAADRRLRARRALRALVALVAVAAAVACDAPSYPSELPSYDPTLAFDTTRGVARFASGTTVLLYADPTGAPAGYDLRAALATAIGRWAEVPRYGDITLAQTTDLRRAQVLVRFRSTTSLVDLGDCAFGGGLGRTAFCGDTTEDGRGVAPALPFADGSAGSRIKLDVYVDPLGASDLVLQQAGQTREEFFVTLLTHELGHVLGIGGHSNDADDLMFGGIIRARRPTTSDEVALRWVWSQPIALRF